MEWENLRKVLKKWTYLAVLWGLAFVFYFLRLRTMLLAYMLIMCVVMVLAILLQSGRGGGLAAIGGMGGENILGTRASTPVAKATFAIGILFMIGALLATKMPPPRVSGTVFDKEIEQKEPVVLPGTGQPVENEGAAADKAVQPSAPGTEKAEANASATEPGADPAKESGKTQND